ncbi:TPA: hypothetical protein ACGEYE_000461 [Klebsiella variicola]
MATKKFAIVLVEGETEKALFRDFKTSLGYPIKKIVIANLWNVSIKKIMPALTEISEIVVVFDTDRIENIERFKTNISLLKAKKHTIYLFQQTRNFEDEIAKACNINNRDLYSSFCSKIVSSDNFKNEFIALHNRMPKLDGLNINKSLLWSRGLIPQLNDYSSHTSSHDAYFS